MEIFVYIDERKIYDKISLSYITSEKSKIIKKF